MGSQRAEERMGRPVCGDEVPANPDRSDNGLTHVCGDLPGHNLPHHCYECSTESWGTVGANFTSWQNRRQQQMRDEMSGTLMAIAGSWWPSPSRAMARDTMREYYRFGFIAPEPHWLKDRERSKAPSGQDRA